ncbi:MAG: RNA-binding protein [Candidatus Hecatellales archaeon]|nr:MAG: RNA-binding protein [Candidatus Hecatellales archaeon]
MYPRKRKTSIVVALPASTTADIPHLREKTFRLGFIGRTLAIFRVDKVLIYRDKPENQDFKVMGKILEYMATPQYLRKKIFRLTPELRYAGVLPPLRTPDHPTRRLSSQLFDGEIRKGLVLKSSKKGSFVDVGVEKPVFVRERVKAGKIVNLKIFRVNGEIKGEIVSLDEIPYYWGFSVELVKQSIGEIVKSGKFNLKISTSKYGKPVEEVVDGLREKWLNSKNVLVVFGSSTEGIKEILARENLKPEDVFDFNLNMIKSQGTETVRVEEALEATLAIFNFLFED